MTVPSVFGLPHLSEDAVAAFADGVLSPAATVRARRHCAECTECAEAVRGQRETAMMLRAASAPALPAGLLDRLAGLPMSAQLPPPLSGLPTALNSDGVPMFVAYQPDRKPDPPEADRRTADPADSQQDRTGLDRTAAGSTDQARIEPTRPAHRRVLLPVSILASAAAVVAAGAIGSNVNSFQPVVDHPAAVNLAPGIVGTNAQVNQTGTDPGTDSSFAIAFGSGQTVSAIQPADLRFRFSTARLRPPP